MFGRVQSIGNWVAIGIAVGTAMGVSTDSIFLWVSVIPGLLTQRRRAWRRLNKQPPHLRTYQGPIA